MGVTQILLDGIVPRTIVQAEAQKPPMITRWPEARSFSYLYMYFPICPPRSSVIHTAALLARVPMTRRAAAASAIERFMCSP
ncbi:hypothetical protein AXW67_14465 [Bradyrhizobium neotropicale]|uniref:Uncharacterized protein n=1 Tax=Bradyrhizobium neotropicale TaxID=1497615 RepID=A0A176Z5L9_9BRAD|nr:hypothetical protein AXW67_14465 [Bradyrhizobium neotropicale]